MEKEDNVVDGIIYYYFYKKRIKKILSFINDFLVLFYFL